MTDNYEHEKPVLDKKARIRERYKGISEDELDVIPAIPTSRLEDDHTVKRVAVYARVSTDDPRQTSSYELQKNHYQDVVNRHIGWKLINIYADEGISGTSLMHRDSFLRMIEDCKAGKIDLILTKSVSRFARNIVDCVSYIRQLRAMKPPVGVMFETEHIYTLDNNSDMSLAFIATLAQEESHTKSEIMNSSIEMRFRRGIFLTPPLLGYDHDENGNLIINEQEALTVRLIFFMYLYGYTCQEIANQLNILRRQTKKGNCIWSAGTVLQQLQNERHCGDVLSRKTWTPNYLDHKSKKNRQDRNQYLQKNHHEPIVSRDDFLAVQHLIRNARYKNNGILPQLNVIKEGILLGFVSVNPRWCGFKAKDYTEASLTVYKNTENPEGLIQVEANEGDFDLRGYEIARSQFFETERRISVAFTSKSFQFSSELYRKLDVEHVELLVHPAKRFLAIRPCIKDERNAIRWSKNNKGRQVPRKISGKAFLPTLYELFKWNINFSYRITGFLKQKEGEAPIILFDLDETEALIPKSLIFSSDTATNEELRNHNVKVLGSRNHVYGYPGNWERNFGSDYYRQISSSIVPSSSDNEKWASSSTGEPVMLNSTINTTSPSDLHQEIRTMISQMKQEEKHESIRHE